MQKYYDNKPKFHGVCLRNNLSKIKVGLYIINLDSVKCECWKCSILW